ncbi:F-box/WD repeat-containing protein 9 [Plakobranchus ocellatus]|uniref:F-box/WD repeat-containing protein 9 n=1 Tax=Plakobranchus ocellatus TaxID=259542 RepID=A0AAV3Z7H9_9GAST|nr:F-box/WD repeat-containing protein 9 [Plakobranchus ocellatus]
MRLTVAVTGCKSALRAAGTFLPRVRASPPASWPDGGPEKPEITLWWTGFIYENQLLQRTQIHATEMEDNLQQKRGGGQNHLEGENFAVVDGSEEKTVACPQVLAESAACDPPAKVNSDMNLPLTAEDNDLFDNGEDSFDPAMWDGIIPIEVTAESQKSEEEDLTCEFCSPRLEAGNQPWCRNDEHQISDDEHEAEVAANFHVADRCLAWDDSHRVWIDPETQTNHFVYSHNVGGVDAVHLMNNGQLVVSGDRNRDLNLIDLTKYPGPAAGSAQKEDMLVHADRTTHNGWIWTVDSVDNMILTGAWDMHIRQFDAAAGCPLVRDYKCTSAILSLFAEEDEVFASCFDKKIYFIDRRSSNLSFRVFHTKAVLCITGNDKYIISGSEDKRIAIFDRRAGKIYKIFKLESYPLCLSYYDNQLWFGDRTGILHLHDGTDGMFKHIGSYDIGHTQKMTGVINTSGAVFTCSGDGTVKVLEPTREPDVLTSLTSHKKEVADVAYSHGVLASAGDDCVSLWLPTHWDRNTYLL